MNAMFFQVRGMNIYLYRQSRTFFRNTLILPNQNIQGCLSMVRIHLMWWGILQATHLIEAGVPLAVVKNILGHSSIQTTQIYLDISQQTVDRTLEEWNENGFQNNPSDADIPKDNNQIPDFLKYGIVIR